MTRQHAPYIDPEDGQPRIPMIGVVLLVNVLVMLAVCVLVGLLVYG